MLQPTYRVPSLPPSAKLETLPVLRACALAHRHLAELTGRAISVPNPAILIDTLTLQEAWASCEIENIVTTQDNLYRADQFPNSLLDPALREVAQYRSAPKRAFDQLQGNDNLSTLDPLVKMAVIHHQFESIHPFADGNGRVGRILNVLYLVRCGLLETPILYLSRAITRSKGEYYRLLQAVRDQGAWEDWVIYILDAVQTTSRHTLMLVERIRTLMADYKREMRERLPKIYSHELLNNLFRHPYTRIDSVRRDLRVARPTAAKYLTLLANQGLVSKRRAGRATYSVNTPLVDLFQESEDDVIG